MANSSHGRQKHSQITASIDQKRGNWYQHGGMQSKLLFKSIDTQA